MFSPYVAHFRRLCSLSLVPTLENLFNDLRAKVFEVARIVRRDDSLIGYD